MTIKIRRLLFIIFIVAFLVIAPLVAFYAAGYKINPSWPFSFKQAFQKTGMLILDTEPRGAKIYLDEEPQQLFFRKYFSPAESYIKTPAKIKNLLPGEYEVKFELDGYWNWQKKLIIKPGESTFAEDVSLFKKDLPMQISSLPAQILKQTPNKKYFYALDDQAIINADDGKKITVSFPSSFQDQDSSDSAWSPDNQKIITSNFLLDLNKPEDPLDLEKTFGVYCQNPRWDENDSSIVYCRKDNAVVALDLSSGVSRTLVSGETCLDYLVKGDYLFVISQVNKTVKLKSFFLKSKEFVREFELPYSPQYELINPEHKFLNLYDARYQILYLIDPLSLANPLKEIINNIKYTVWAGENKLFYANDFEVWSFDPENNKKTILTRISRPIIGLLRHPSGNYIIYATDKNINILELDERERRNVIELIKLDKISSLYIDQKGDLLGLAL